MTCNDEAQSLQFYKFAASIAQQLLLSTSCFVKINTSTRKMRRVFLSNVAMYIVANDKLRERIGLRFVTNVLISTLSGEILLVAAGKYILLDTLLREIIRNAIQEANITVVISNIPQPLLDPYCTPGVQPPKQSAQLINLTKLKREYEVNENIVRMRKGFSQMYTPVELIKKGGYWQIISVERIRNQVKITKQQKKKKEKEIKQMEMNNRLTVKVYSKKGIGFNKGMVNDILNERKYLQMIISPYVPTLVKSFISSQHLFLVCEGYRGGFLRDHLGDGINKKGGDKLKLNQHHKLRILLAQIVTALGQVHQCNAVYNNLNPDGIFLTDDGYILLNNFNRCRSIGEQFEYIQYVEGGGQYSSLSKYHQYSSPESLVCSEVSFAWDWWQLANLIHQIKEGVGYNHGRTREEMEELYDKGKQGEKLVLSHLKWEEDLLDLVGALFEKDPQVRIGSKNDYHQILRHKYFQGIKKKDLTQRSIQPIPIKLMSTTTTTAPIFEQKQEDDWTIFDASLKQYQFNRQIEE